MRNFIISKLFEMQDKKYRDFTSALIPTVDKDRIIGVRTPKLKGLAKEVFTHPDLEEFLTSLPHEYCEENTLHGLIINRINDYSECISELERFLPYIDNWGTCDSIRPNVFKKNKEKLLSEIERWISSTHTYTIRFAIEMFMVYFLDDDFEPYQAELVASVESEEYYVNMMIAWYFATALAKQWDSAIKFLENATLDKWVHNKTIQKAVESFRITDVQKTYLKSLKVR